MGKRESISEINLKKIEYWTVNSVDELLSAVNKLSEKRYPSVTLEKKRNVISRYNFKVDAKHQDYIYNTIVKSYFKLVNRKMDYENITQGQYIKYLEKNTLGKVEILISPDKFEYFYVEEDSIYKFGFKIRPSLFFSNIIIDLRSEVFLPFAADVFGFKTFSSRVDYKLRNRTYHRDIARNLKRSIELGKKDGVISA